MQGRNRNYNAFETSAVEDWAVAVLCGEGDFKVCFVLFAQFCSVLPWSKQLFYLFHIRFPHLLNLPFLDQYINVVVDVPRRPLDRHKQTALLPA
jgi:hypothetical protein